MPPDQYETEPELTRWPRAIQALVDAGMEVTRGRPLDGPGVGLRIFPWVSAGVLAFALVPALPESSNPQTLVAAALMPVIILAALFAPWERLPSWAQAVPALVPLVMVALIRTVNDSPETAYTPVVLLPVFWFALYGTRTELLVSVLAVGATLAVPSGAVAGDAYPLTEPAAAFLWMTIAGISGATISELVRQREVLEVRLGKAALTDSLTGLPNRRAWDEALEPALSRSARTGTPVCAVLLDLDHFKEFNDMHGHQAGDEHLKSAAAWWSERLRATDLIARYGGEEFAVLLSGTTLKRAEEVVLELLRSVPREETVSAGIAQWDRSETGPELLARADLSLYEAKRTGRDRIVVSPETDPADYTADAARLRQ